MLAYGLSIGSYIGIFAILAMSLNLIWGMAGMINLGMIGFFGIGAYTAALTTTKAGIPFVAGTLLAAGTVSMIGAAIAHITWRLRGDYLAVVTLGFSEFFRLTASNEIWLTNGTDGISNIDFPLRRSFSLLEFQIGSFLFILALVAVTCCAFYRLCYSPFGRALRAIRDDEEASWTAGKNSRAMKVRAFAIAGFFSGAAGAIYAHFNSYIAPDSFLPLLSLYVVFAVTIGGKGNVLGAVLGMALIVAFTEGTRFLVNYVEFLRPVQGAALREMTVSCAFLVILLFMPRGLLPEQMSSWTYAKPRPQSAHRRKPPQQP
jgi:branched-chain amino acid transport system permease protein